MLDGKVIDVQVSLYAYPNAEFMEGKPYGSYVVTDDDSSIDLKIFNEAVLKALSPVPDGCTHMELFKKPDGEIVFLEIAARPSFGFVPKMYEHYMGVDLEEMHYRCQMGLSLPAIKPLSERKESSVGWLWYPKISGEVTSLSKRLPIKSEHDIQYCVRATEKLEGAETLRDYVATVFMVNPDRAQLIADFNVMKSVRPVTIYPKPPLAIATELEHQEQGFYSLKNVA